MAQMNRTRGVIAMAGLLAGLAMAGVPAFAQTSAPAPGASPDKGMMMNQEMMQKMSRMIDNCNRMMESKMQNKDGTTTSPAKPNKG
jgi:hypothetical protein